MNKKRIRERAARLGISYQQAKMLNQARKPQPSEEEQQWNRLTAYAADLDMAVEDQEETGFFLSGHGVAITFTKNAQGVKQALAWLEKFEKEQYEL